MLLMILKKKGRLQRMVKLNKRSLPDGISPSSENDYRSGVTFDMLVEDCYGKCYICEDKPTSINVEHIVPHRGDAALRYCWDNMLLACGHCNGLKGVKYDDIINPTLLDPEDYLDLSVEISEDFLEFINVTAVRNEYTTSKTVELLRSVYNGGSTPIKSIESANLRNEHLLPDLLRFRQYIRGYLSEPDMGYDTIIIKEISRSSKFAAFKRKIVRDNLQLYDVFSDALA